LDIRSKTAFQKNNIIGSINIPMKDLLSRYFELDLGASYTVICDHGVNSITACEFLCSKGFDVLSFPGGIASLTKEIHA
jgi:rhodanese-related sulfurtransferase